MSLIVKDTYRVGFVHLGCAKNRVDTEIMETLLSRSGFQLRKRGFLDAVIVNTCGFIGDAKEESLEEIFRVVGLKKAGRVGKILVGGCLSQRYLTDLAREIPEVDRFFGLKDVARIGEILIDVIEDKPLGIPPGKTADLEDAYLLRLKRNKTGWTYLKISDGCSNNCVYCTIPSIRGPLKSRYLRRVKSEFRAIVEKGIKEVNVIGQDIGSYGRDREGSIGLEGLLEELAPIVSGDIWLRLLYLHPENVTERLVRIMKESPFIVNYLDIPVQHASDRILAKMNRRYTRGYLYDLFSMLRQVLDDIVLRTTVMVGFPGERQVDFEYLQGFLEDVRFDRLGGFIYSREENTPAWNMGRRVERDTAVLRLEEILTVQSQISLENNRLLQGKKVKVLVEEAHRAEGRLTGRYYGQAPEVDGVVSAQYRSSIKRGDFVPVKISHYDHYDLFGEVAGEKTIDF